MADNTVTRLDIARQRRAALAAHLAPSADRLADLRDAANAAAAAPDLLEALRDMLPLALEALKERAKTIDGGVSAGGDDEDGLPAGWELRNRLYAARAAIAKAEGQ